MSEAQKIYDQCAQAYGYAYSIVESMAGAVAEMQKQRGKEFNPNITMAKFDIVLQYSLLQLAVADNHFDASEVVFVSNLTHKGDLLSYANATTKSSLKWEDLYHADIQTVRKFVAAYENIMIQLSDEVVAVIGLCDKATEHDYLADLTKAISAIIAGLVLIDGDARRDEVEEPLLILRTINRIKEYKNQ